MGLPNAEITSKKVFNTTQSITINFLFLFKKKKPKNLHSHGVAAEGVENVGGAGEVQNQLLRARVLHALNLIIQEKEISYEKIKRKQRRRRVAGGKTWP